MCASTQRGKTKALLCYAQTEKTYSESRGKRALNSLFNNVTRLYRRRKNSAYYSLGHLDTHPSSLSKKTSHINAVAFTLSRARFFRLASPPYISATFAGCLQALLTISRATLASKGAGRAGKANRGTLYRDIYTSYIYPIQ